MAEQFDIIVIGAGSGLEVSASASARGLRVAVVDEGPFGGTCLNRGCIPSKMLIHCADVAETVRRAGSFGIDAELRGVDWDFIVSRASRSVDADAAAIEQGNREDANTTVFRAPCRFVGDKTIDVGGDRIRAETIVIAAGTRPAVPDIAGLDEVPYITSDQALRLPAQPRRLIIAGGGFVAAELAHFFGALGTEVTIVQRGARMLQAEDEEISQRFTEVYGRRFALHLNSTIASVARSGDALTATLRRDREEQRIEADALLLATGRRPNTDTLDVGASGVAVDARGFVTTDEFLETNVPGIWALGDIVGRYLLKHSANLEAGYVAYNIFHAAEKLAVDYHAMPHAVFASPQVASVGLTERAAVAAGRSFDVGRYDYENTAYGSSIEDKDGFVKAIADRDSGEILGCHIIGTDASTLIQEAANAMRMRLTSDAIGGAIYVHPALPEVVQRAFGSIGR